MKELETFFNVMTRFNKLVQIDENIRDQIDKYFMYRWAKDRSLALTS